MPERPQQSVRINKALTPKRFFVTFFAWHFPVQAPSNLSSVSLPEGGGLHTGVEGGWLFFYHFLKKRLSLLCFVCFAYLFVLFCLFYLFVFIWLWLFYLCSVSVSGVCVAPPPTAPEVPRQGGRGPNVRERF